jgi:F420-0:gamma-glutamyl ligase
MSFVRREADAYLAQEDCPYHLTIKNQILIPSAGIDQSNGDGTYILYPENIQETAATLWRHLRDRHCLTKVGVIITDSHTTPLRKGVTGITLGWCGFEPLHSYIGQPDIFGQPLRVTQINILDALAAFCCLCYGRRGRANAPCPDRRCPKNSIFALLSFEGTRTKHPYSF